MPCRGGCGAGCDANFNKDGFALAPGVEGLIHLGLLTLSAEARLDVLAFERSASVASFIGLGAGFSL